MKKALANQSHLRVKNPKVEMTEKRNISIQVRTGEITEEDLKKIMKTLEFENLELRKKYYSSNIPIIQTQQRKFSELLRRFINLIIKKCKQDNPILNNRPMK